MNIFKWLRNKPKGNPTPETLLEDLRKKLEEIEALADLQIQDQPYIKNPLVSEIILDNKIREFTVSYNAGLHQLNNAVEFLQCLHNWVHTPPPTPKKSPLANNSSQLSKEDEEFLERLEAAKEKQKQAQDTDF